MLTSMRNTAIALGRGVAALAVAVTIAVTIAVMAAAVAPSTASAATRTYRVVAGDTITSISARFGVTPSALVAANGISNPNDILIGTRLVIPPGTGGTGTGPGGGGTSRAGAATGTGSTRTGRTGTYVVAPGDTLSGIAARFGVSTATLIAANDLTNPDVVVIGTRLVIPPPGTTPDEVGTTGTATGTTTTKAPSGPLAPVYAPAAGSPRYPAQLLAHSSRLALRPVFQHWARVYGVAPGLLEALSWMESGWQNTVVSSTGAIGIGQLEPSTVKFVSTTLLGLSTPLNPHIASANIQMSAAYLAWMIRAAHGSYANALGGYYQGLGSLYASGPFPSTRNYVLVIGELWHQFHSG